MPKNAGRIPHGGFTLSKIGVGDAGQRRPRGSPGVETYTPVNIGNRPYRDNGEGVAARPLPYPLRETPLASLMRRKRLANAALRALHDTPRRTSDMAAEKMWVMTSVSTPGQRTESEVRPEGTAESKEYSRSSLRDEGLSSGLPGVETPGYCQMSLRDKARAAYARRL